LLLIHIFADAIIIRLCGLFICLENYISAQIVIHVLQIFFLPNDFHIIDKKRLIWDTPTHQQVKLEMLQLLRSIAIAWEVHLAFEASETTTEQ
jgi:hypothetical protein